jgi:putative ABC transport system ATP-binding protein
MSGPLIVVDRLARHYVVGGETVRALDGVTFEIQKGEWVAIVGQSGSGKSTLMNLIGCLDTATSGTYRLNGADVETLADDALADLRNKEIGFIFQTFQLLPRATALANVELPLVYRGLPRRERRASPTACTTGPTSSPAASASASRWRAPWWATRPSCWPTSPPATSTPRPARRSCGSSRS